MLEWLSVKEEVFVNAFNNATNVKLRYEPQEIQGFTEVNPEGKDIDALAFEYMGTEAESLRLLNANPLIVEYKFNMKKLSKIKIPV